LNGNLIEDHVGKVDIRSDSPVEGLPESVSFTEKDRGTVNLEGLKVRTPGIYRISLHDEKSSVVAEANPIQCLVSVRERIYWGDLHTHGYDANDPVFLGWLNRTNHPTSCHQYARDVARLDFCSLSPMNPPPESDVPELWKLYRRVVEEMNEPGRYVTFMGPEWHGLGGDRTIVSKDPNFTIPYPKMPIEELYAEYADNPNVLMIPHVGGGIADWDYFTPKEGEHLIEVASGHGNFEWILQDAAFRGFKVGVTGSTDNLFGCPGRPRSVLIAMGRFFGLLNRRDSGYGSGPITAVLAKSLTREGIWEALRARKMYATTGARIILEFDVDGKPMGSIIKMETVPVLRVEVHGTAPIDRIDIIRNNSLLHSLKGGEKDVSFEIEDKSIPLGESYYYVRVSQIDGEYAWSTPIWVSNIGYAPQKAEVLPWNKDEDIDLVKLRPNEAEKFEEALKDYISRVEDPDCFDEVTPVKIVNAPEGKYALFYAYIKPERKRISIKWFYQFEMPRVRFETGWRDFGICEPI